MRYRGVVPWDFQECPIPWDESGISQTISFTWDGINSIPVPSRGIVGIGYPAGDPIAFPSISVANLVFSLRLEVSALSCPVLP